MLTNEIAIVGIDSQFGEFANIDRVARALYVGKELSREISTANIDDELAVKAIANSPIDSAITSVIHSRINDATKRMLSAVSSSELSEQAHKKQLKQLEVIVVSEQLFTLEDGFPTESHLNSIVVVSQLSDALTRAISLIDKGNLVALVGLNLDSSNKGAEQSSIEASNTISFDRDFSGYQSTSGIASLLLAPQVLAQQAQLPIYAQLNGLSVSAVNATAMTEAVLNSLKNIENGHVGLVEVSALADDFYSNLESSALLEAYREAYAGESLTRAISCARSITGEGAGFSQVLGLLRTVIALQQRYIPGNNHWQTPTSAQLTNWESSSFYFPTESRTRYPNADGSKHSAAYSCLTAESYCHLVLTEHTLSSSDEDIRLNGFLASSELQLVLVTGENEAELQQNLLTTASLLQDNNGQNDLQRVAEQHYQQYLTTTAKKFNVALLAESNEELAKEIQLAQLGIKNAFVNLSQPELGKSTQWKTPKGSYFSAEPAATSAENSAQISNNVCFMYPGIGATYVGLGRDLFQLFPEIYNDVADLADDIGSSLKDTLLNPRSISRLDFKELKQRDLALRGNLADIAEAGVGFACVFSKIFTKVFKLNADFATGYSMGEVSMYAALGCWQQPGLMSARLASSATFNERLCGDLLTLREHWDLPLPNTNTEAVEAPIWETYTIKATLAQVEAACIGESRVYCTIINTPDSVLLAGFPADCLRVIDKLGVRAMALNMANAIHSAPAKAEYDDMVALYTMAVNARINTKLYSSSCYLPVPQLSKAIAHSIAKCLCERVDFPRLVNTLYNNGARVFIEMGPGRSLCSWVDKTLEHENKQQQLTQVTGDSNNASVSVPVNAKGVSDELTYFRAIAKLVSHGVNLDLNSLFYGSIVMRNKVMATKNRSANAAQKSPASQ